MSAAVAGPITLAVAILPAGFIWQMEPDRIGAALLEGAVITVEILIIVFGALFMLNILNSSGVFDSVRQTITRLTPDIRIQAIIIGWFLVSFIEGAAGFGTPGMLAAPLLVILGFKPLTAVAIALIGDSASVTFGAVGLPITIGIAEGAIVEGFTPSAEQLQQIAVSASLLHLLAGFFIPLVISLIAARSHTGSLKRGWEAAPFALIAGFCYLIPAYLASYWLTPEFPALVGGMVGGLLVVLIIRFGLFRPADPIVPAEEENVSQQQPNHQGGTLKAFWPYLLVIFLLILTRAPFIGLGDKLSEFSLDLSHLPGLTEGQLDILNSPGVVFLIAGMITAVFWGLNRKQLIAAGTQTVQRLTKPMIGLLAVLGLVQIFRSSGDNLSGLQSMPLHIAETLPEIPFLTVFLSPFLGMLGSFIAGGSTVSNLLFSSFQTGMAETLGLSVVLMLALQAAGSALGNMLAVHNVLTAQATVGLTDREGDIIRITLLPALIYAGLVGVIGLLLMVWIS